MANVYAAAQPKIDPENNKSSHAKRQRSLTTEGTEEHRGNLKTMAKAF